jgi:dihydrofolate reductase
MERQEVIWHITMSVDGFIAGRDDDMAPLLGASTGSGEPGPMARDVMESIGAILGGRRWYDVAMERYDGRRGIYGGAWSGPILVLTHNPPTEPEDPDVVFVSGPLDEAVRRGLVAAAPKNLVIFGADVAKQCLAAGLLDEIVIHVAPVLLGDGVPLFRDAARAAEPIRLERIALDGRTQVTDLQFRVKPRMPDTEATDSG